MAIAHAASPDAPATPVAIDVDHTVDSFVGYADSLTSWLSDLAKELLSPVSGWQALAVVTILALGYVASRYPARALMDISERHASVPMLHRLYRSLSKLCWPIIAVVLLWIVGAVWRSLGLNGEILRVATSLLSALIAVQFLAYNMRTGFWSRLFAITAWVVSALYILHLFDPFVTFLDSSAITIAGSRISALGLITSLIAVVLALWIGRLAGDAAQSRLRDSANLNPSMAGLLGQVAKAVFMIMAIVVALYAAGINLTALTVFTGALGVGIGFGLQAIFSNFISGVIILMEKSVKVGDFIELPTGVTGLVTEINIRSTLVTTNDNVDILVPNEEFIKAQVINWTLRDSRRRQRIPFGVAYGTDKELVRKAGLEAAAAVDWTFDDGTGRVPQVWLVGFGDSSLDFELVVWLTEEAVKKPARVKADYYWALHTVLEKYDIEIPFPQRDLHFKTGSPSSLG